MIATVTHLQPNSPAGLLSACFDELNRIADFPPDWDGYGAKPLDFAIYRAVLVWMMDWSEHLENCHVVATSAGGIQLEWHGIGRILELEFIDSTKIEYLQWWPEQGVKNEGSFAISDGEICGELLHWAHGNGG